MGNIVKRLFKMGMKFKKWFVLAFIISIFTALISTYRPIFTKKIVDVFIIKEKSSEYLIQNIYILLFLTKLQLAI